MISKVFAFMEEYRMIEEGDLVIIGVSGGADSLCLLMVLLEYRKRKHFFPAVVHINHGLRKEAYEEAEYVRKICDEKGIPFYLVEADVKETVKEKKVSEEEAGRMIRYQAFEEALQFFDRKEIREKKIAVAHHGGDQAETLLFHLFRGTGIYGMAGIMPKREQIIRPLLCLQREEIETYLKQRKIRWCNDKTNEEDHYTRNKIRHHILPYATECINEKSVEHVAKAAMQMVELRQYLEEEVEKARKLCCYKEKEEMILLLEQLMELPLLIRKQLILTLLSDVLPGRKDIGSIHVNHILELCEKSGTKEVMLPSFVRVKKEYGRLIFYRKKDRDLEKKPGDKKQVIQKEEKILEAGESYEIGEDMVLELKLLKKEDSFIIEENRYTKFLDYDKIKNCLSLRTRQTGDYLTINNKGQKKKLKEFMIEEKIPRDRRDLIPVIAEGAHVLWLIGYRISAYYKVSEGTTNLIQMTIRRREEHGRES